ncbi:MAG: glycosyltransferase, partial [Bacteroidales bacterium]
MAWYNVVDVILFVLFLINIGYLLVFSVASLFRQKPRRSDSLETKRIAILIPAYKEDAVIGECVNSCLKQQYPKERYDVVVISDRMTDKTNDALQQLPIKLVKVYFESSTKSKALNTAMDQLGDEYDIAVVLDADNIIFPDFLTQINNLFQHDDVQIVQAHRCAKNLNTSLALLDALSEEINNGIFRKGHVKLGFSAALIGSGMAFDYKLFKTSMLSIDAIGGFDRALELNLLREGKRIHYLPYSDVLDEKIQHG